MENRRKDYFIKKGFQAKFIMNFCVLVMFSALISSSVIYMFLSRTTVTIFENSRIVVKPSTEFIIPGLILSVLISIVLVGAAAIIILLFISHRIAGPLYKLESSLERLGTGDLSFDICFRNNDEARALSNAFNIARRSLNGMIDGIKTGLKEGRDVTEKIEKFKLG